MCGIVVAIGGQDTRRRIGPALDSLVHRGPDDHGRHDDGPAAFGHRRLSILDLSAAGRQPMVSPDGRFVMLLNGEIYNYVELRAELGARAWRTQTDTEVALAAYEAWGAGCLDRFRGMFALTIWDTREQRLFAARDRFGVKPMYYHAAPDGTLLIASEIKALIAAGVSPSPDRHAWRQYLAYGLYEHSDRTFFEGIRTVPAGHALTWQHDTLRVTRWYDLAARVCARYPDVTPESDVRDGYVDGLFESVRLRFRSDVPVGINVSGGLDSSLLLALVHRVQGADSNAAAFTYTCGDSRYDEAPWAERMLAGSNHPWQVAVLNAADTPAAAAQLARAEDEPFGGLPTIMTSLLCGIAKQAGVTVLMDGQGMDEQWAGYDYYWQPDGSPAPAGGSRIQGSTGATVRPDLLQSSFFGPVRHPMDGFPAWSGDALLDARLRDILHTKLPRALRFNDRASMMQSCELREPFLDHPLVELALAQPVERLNREGKRKFLLREIARDLVPRGVSTQPKRPVQSPQREWLAGPLAAWVLKSCAESELVQEWFTPGAADSALESLRSGRADNSFAVWQMLSLALWDRHVLHAGQVSLPVPS